MNQREAIESMYKDTCDIIQLVSVKDPVTKRTSMTEQVVHSNIPCKLSVKNLASVSDTATNSDTAAVAVQVTTVFMAPELDIPVGSKFLVTHFGRKFKYESSGYPAIYSSHQEIRLERSDWA